MVKYIVALFMKNLKFFTRFTNHQTHQTGPDGSKIPGRAPNALIPALVSFILFVGLIAYILASSILIKR
ncbi:MAG: hypothetical protein COV91_01985 [Candidatus Taylorbacteria bacterium CG11_big_fil_rev_8_21_14_0_20_46_11]|uniref:Uncharacterized protein n=1 Tax=Candidatus Taylorbacteria bacterium CG11_big_fil_rev_8_21_14_0_20_46_11 TaxID=1975025 RepID=A0A2H0KEK5_9BACT|nr:MAG: hypothetical protein COV91_01985 [Candidatus Taylorbacteria bacterium CG11_big_fil_rev_8_21_14_0_20_46_11]